MWTSAKKINGTLLISVDPLWHHCSYPSDGFSSCQERVSTRSIMAFYKSIFFVSLLHKTSICTFQENSWFGNRVVTIHYCYSMNLKGDTNHKCQCNDVRFWKQVLERKYTLVFRKRYPYASIGCNIVDPFPTQEYSIVLLLFTIIFLLTELSYFLADFSLTN